MSDSAIPFPPAIDNTMVSAFRACPRKFWWRHLQWLQKGEISIHLVSGGAFAKGLEVVRKCFFDKGMSFEDSLAHGAAAAFVAYGNVDPIPRYTNKSAANIVGALAYYFETWPIDRIIKPYRPNDAAKHTIEWNFSVPIPGVSHPDNGGPILYCGRFDMVGRHDSGLLLGEDDKTTSQLGDQWFNNWRVPNQILGYMWGAKEHGMNLGGFNIRGISMLKHEYGHAETVLMVNDWEIERFKDNLVNTVKRMVKAYKRYTLFGDIPAFEMNMAGACSAYGGCDYLNLCTTKEPDAFIPIHYVKSEWNPLASRD